MAARLQVEHTSALDPGTLEAARALLDEVFAEEMTDADWEHGLGGMHALAWEGERLIAHASVIQRQLIYGDRAFRTGYVECVAVRADSRGRGYGAAVMDPLERIIRAAYELGALGASEMGEGFYAHRGWTPWRGRTWAVTPGGVVRTEAEDDSIYVLAVGLELDPSADLTCDWREGDLW